MRPAIFSFLLLVVVASAHADATNNGNIRVTGQFNASINKAHPDWTTPVLTLPATPPCSVTSSDNLHVSLNCGSWLLNVYTKVTTNGAISRSRSIVVHADHFEVDDTFTSLDPVNVLGVHFRNFVGTSSPWPMLAGLLAPNGDAPSPWNPTVFTPLGNVGVGLVMEDDVMRIQGRVDNASVAPYGPSVGIKTDLLCFPPLTSQTLVWSIYPTSTNSYYDFINRVRTNWNVNYQVPGSYIFWVPSTITAFPGGQPALAAQLAAQGTTIACLGGGWTDNNPPMNPIVIGFGTYVMSTFFATYRTEITAAAAELNAIGINAVNLYYNWARDSTPNANTVFPDSLMTDITNTPITNTFGGVFTTAWNTIPTSTNSYGIAMQAIANPDMLDLCPGNNCSLYLDEMETYDYIPFGTSPPVTFNQWDNKTCLLQPSGAIIDEIAEVALISESNRLSILASMPSPIIGNTPPLLRATTDRHDMRFVEIEGNHAPGGTSRAGFVNLTSPLCYISSLTDWQTFLDVINNGCLPVTNSLTITNDLLALEFPFTPENLQPGTLRGDERIITTPPTGTTMTSKQGWTIGGHGVTAYRLNAAGKKSIVPPSVWPVTNGPGGLFVQVSLGVNEAAVLVRTP